MLRLLLVVIIIVHGLIHLLGFVKEWQLAKVPQLTGKTLIPIPGSLARPMGLLWLIVSCLFIGAMIAFLLKKEWWWLVAAPALLLSQVLIVLYWQDAKFGTIANVLLLPIVVVAGAIWNFYGRVDRELQVFLADAGGDKKIVTSAMLTELPPVVQKWLRRSNVVGKEIIQTVHLRQIGEMKSTAAGKWLPMTAEQYCTTDHPGFLWWARIRALPLIHIVGRDKYENGHGVMLIKLLGLFKIADTAGKEIDQGALVRYLAETTWYPSAALNDYIRWQEIDSLTARATMSYGGTTASGTFRFTSAADLVSFEALRYYFRKEGSSLENWFVTVSDDGYREFAGIRIPTKLAVTWKSKTGDFTWLKLELTEVEFNPVNK